jgi:hypothetical protein
MDRKDLKAQLDRKDRKVWTVLDLNFTVKSGHKRQARSLSARKVYTSPPA